jgi:DNA-binding SARP family transcriptional activator/ATP/maltotriose-dependent transcriptional regulator MalT
VEPGPNLVGTGGGPRPPDGAAGRAPPGRLPSYHVPRPRLTGQCRDERIVILEAAAGYGKSVLAAELVNTWGAVPVEVLLEDGGVPARLLASRLRAAVLRAGFVNAAGSMAAPGDDPAGAVDAMLDALAGEACAFVVDDAHHALRDAGVLIERIAIRLAVPQRLIVSARQLPPGAERLRRADAVRIGAAELSLRPEETIELCRSGFGLEISAGDARFLDAATGGWTAAAVLAVSRAKRTAIPLRDVAGTGSGPGEPHGAVASILDELIVALGRGKEVLARIAPLPLLDRDLLATVTGDEGFFEQVVALGLPLTPAGSGWWTLPGPVRDHLARLGRPDPAALARAAAYYAGRGEMGTALQMLLAAGEAEEAARLLAAAGPQSADALDALELVTVIGRIPDEVLDRHPSALFYAARACGFASLFGARTKLLAHLDETVSEQEDPALRRTIDIAIATDLLNGERPLDALPIALRVLDTVAAGEQFTRARALYVLGVVTCFRRDTDGMLSEATLREAAGYLDQATEIYIRMGFPENVSSVAVDRAIRVELGAGRPQAALDVLDAALSQAAGQPRRIGRLLFYRAQVLTELGQYEEAETTLEESLRVRSHLPDIYYQAMVHWERMILASMRGDAALTLEQANQVEANRSDWWAPGGAEFLGDAADCLDRVGHTALAWEYLERARAHPQDAEALIAMAECALLARHGDPVLAEEKLAVVHRHGIFPRERWRVTLLRACAAWRRGDPAAGPLAARAFEEAARLGQPQLPLIREREISESLMALAVETGSAAAAALESASLPMALALLGRFALTRGGRPVTIGPGQAAQLLKMVAVKRGRLPAERAIETLWPEADPAAGRNRLRTVLVRLKEAAPDAVSRDGELLTLGAGIRVDLAQFDQEARQALALRSGNPGAAVAVAHSAIARYRGELLPDDPYEDWADEPREAARRQMLDLLDLCATAAAERGDHDEARRMVERSLDIAPLEEDRYLRVARILRDQGRTGAALSVLRRARAVLAPLGIDVPLQLPGSGKTAAA